MMAKLLKLLITTAVIAVGLLGYVYFCTSQYVRLRPKQEGVPEARFDGVKKVSIEPMELLEKLTKSMSLDLGERANP